MNYELCETENQFPELNHSSLTDNIINQHRVSNYLNKYARIQIIAGIPRFRYAYISMFSVLNTIHKKDNACLMLIYKKANYVKVGEHSNILHLFLKQHSAASHCMSRPERETTFRTVYNHTPN